MTDRLSKDRLLDGYVSVGRLYQEVRRAARRRRITGDPLNLGAPLGTLETELIAVDICLELPREIAIADKELALKMCRAVVRDSANGGIQ